MFLGSLRLSVEGKIKRSNLSGLHRAFVGASTRLLLTLMSIELKTRKADRAERGRDDTRNCKNVRYAPRTLAHGFRIISSDTYYKRSSPESPGRAFILTMIRTKVKLQSDALTLIQIKVRMLDQRFIELRDLRKAHLASSKRDELFEGQTESDRRCPKSRC